jgi:LuxR family maltose regulon positive regulatory protein
VQPDFEAAVTLLLNDLAALRAHSVLVLEDYHTITTLQIHRQLGFLLEHLPATLHLVMLTRTDPPLPLARLRAQHHLNELRAEDLQFSLDETRTFLRQALPYQLPDDAIAHLSKRTEGWVAGLHLRTLSLRRHQDVQLSRHALATVSGRHRHLTAYFGAEVLKTQPESIQAFLLQTSGLGRLTARLCNAVSGRHDSAAILEHLERANLFIVPLDEDGQWYRYHGLFAESVQHVARRRLGEDALNTGLSRASAWYEQQGLVAETVQHALQAQDVDRATRLIEQHGLALALQGQISTVLGWLATLPQPLIRTRPHLSLLHAIFLASTNQLEAVEARLPDADEAITANLLTDEARRIRGQVALLRANIAYSSGDLARAVALAQQAVDLLPDGDVIGRGAALVSTAHAYRVTGDVTLVTERFAREASLLARASGNLLAYIAAVTNLAELHVRQGRLHQAAATYQEAAEAAPGSLGLQVLVNAERYYFGLGNLLREWNDLEVAEEQLAHGMAMVQGRLTVTAESVTQGYMAYARLLQARGDQNGAGATVDRFGSLAHQRSFAAPLLAHAAAVRAQLWLAQGQLDAALNWADASGLHVDDVDLPYLQEVEYLILARVRIAQGRDAPTAYFLDSVIRLLNRLLTTAEANGRMGSVIEILVLRALALKAHGDTAGALTTLKRTIELGAPEGYIRVFVDEGPAMAELLGEAQRRGIAPDYAAKLLAAFPRTEGRGLRTESAESIHSVLSPQHWSSP